MTAIGMLWPATIVRAQATAVQTLVRESSEHIVDLNTERLLERLPTLNLALPDELSSDRDVYLLATCGGAVCDVRLLARPSVDPLRLARTLQTALRGSAYPDAICEWSHEADYAAAHWTASRARYGLAAHAMSLPVGRLAAGLREAGYIPHVLLRVPNYAAAPPLALPRWQGINSLFYRADDAPLDCALQTSTRLSSVEAGIAWFLMLGVGAVGIVGLLAGLLAARVTAQTVQNAQASKSALDARRALFARLTTWPLWTTLFVTTCVGFFYMSSQTAAKTADLWLGSAARSSTVVFVLPNVTVFLLLSVAGFVLRANLFAVPPTEQEQTIVVLSQEERAIRRRIGWYSLIPLACGFALFLMRPVILPGKHPLAPIWTLATMFLCSFGSYGVRWMFRRQLQELEDAVTDDSLTQRGERLGRELGTPVTVVRVSHSESARRYSSVQTGRRGRLIVSQKCVESLTTEELDFAMAYALAQHGKALRVIFLGPLLALPLIVATSGLMIGWFPVSHTWRLPLIFTAYIGMMLGALCYGTWSRKTGEYHAVRRALHTTGNLTAAESVTAKMPEYNDIMGSRQSYDKAQTARLDVLRRAAHDLGIL